MLKTPRGLTSKDKAAKHWSLVLFSVGGRRFAVQAHEVGGVRPWNGSLPVPSQTPFIASLVRHGDEVLPVYDLAGRLRLRVESLNALCLVAKRRDGAIAICIDAEIPSLRTLDPSAIRRLPGQDADVTGICTIGMEDVPIFSFKALGLPQGAKG